MEQLLGSLEGPKVIHGNMVVFLTPGRNLLFSLLLLPTRGWQTKKNILDHLVVS